VAWPYSLALLLAAQSLLTRIARMQEAPTINSCSGCSACFSNRNLGRVAVAAKLARIAWAVEARARSYSKDRSLTVSEPVACKDRKMA